MFTTVTAGLMSLALLSSPGLPLQTSASTGTDEIQAVEITYDFTDLDAIIATHQVVYTDDSITDGNLSYTFSILSASISGEEAWVQEIDPESIEINNEPAPLSYPSPGRVEVEVTSGSPELELSYVITSAYYQEGERGVGAHLDPLQGATLAQGSTVRFIGLPGATDIWCASECAYELDGKSHIFTHESTVPSFHLFFSEESSLSPTMEPLLATSEPSTSQANDPTQAESPQDGVADHKPLLSAADRVKFYGLLVLSVFGGVVLAAMKLRGYRTTQFGRNTKI